VSPPSSSRLANLEFFLTHDVPAVRTHHPDLDRVLAHGDRVVPAFGTSSAGPVLHCAHALADRLGTKPEPLPGGHNGFSMHPRAYTARLRELLTDQPV